MKNQSGTIKTNLELDRVVMGGSGGYRRLPGESDHFSWQTDIHFNIYIIIIIIMGITYTITIVQAVCRPLVYRSPYGPICFSNMITNILSHMWTSLGSTGQEPLQTCPSLTKLLPYSQVPRPTFGSGSGLQCVYTVVISLWGTPAPTFLLEPPKTLFYWIPLCFRKPQAEFQKFSSTHGSPSDRFISSPRSPLLVGIKDEEYLSIWSLYFSVHVSFHFFVDHLP